MVLDTHHKLGPSQTEAHSELDEKQRARAAPPSQVDGYSLAVNFRFLFFLVLTYGLGFI
jgi:hypothetical protein